MADLTLPRGEIKVLQAEDKDYKRGLLVRLLKDGGYDMAYWYDKPDKPYPVEVLVDGKSIIETRLSRSCQITVEAGRESERPHDAQPRVRTHVRGNDNHASVYG